MDHSSIFESAAFPLLVRIVCQHSWPEDAPRDGDSMLCHVMSGWSIWRRAIVLSGNMAGHMLSSLNILSPLTHTLITLPVA